MSQTIDGTNGQTYPDGTVQTTAFKAGAVTQAFIGNGAVGPAQLSGAQSGSAPVYGCRAWCTWTGSTGALVAGGSSISNVTSVTRNAPGNWTVNFTTPMPDANYQYCLSFSGAAATGQTCGKVTATAQTVNGITVFGATNGVGAADLDQLSIAIFR